MINEEEQVARIMKGKTKNEKKLRDGAWNTILTPRKTWKRVPFMTKGRASLSRGVGESRDKRSGVFQCRFRFNFRQNIVIL